MIIGNNQKISIFANHNFSSSQNKKDSLIEGIQKQIENVQEQMWKISENEGLSTEQKLDMQKDLREQLDELNKQLMERNMEVQKEEKEKREKESQEQMKNKSVKDEYIANGNEGINLISLSSSLKKVSAQNGVKTKIKGQARVLANEIKIDEGRGLDVTNKKERLSEINSKIKSINKQIQNSIKDVNDEIKKVNGQAKEKGEVKENEEVVKEDKNEKHKQINGNKVKENSTEMELTKRVNTYV
ncbi:FlxA-like family protein [Haloimpatiens massiliensis]|uniref:FlxA-like family protein n=1 Tax=Haloimpatiens massiliensis TaxID=1658110 RepID=UPI000C82169B|nr:FlxA-like family protein [Haloimpatiens massiliensis]